MRKLFFLAFLLSVLSFAQTTPNLNLNIPTPLSPITNNVWGGLLNANFSSLDTLLGGGGNGILKRTSPNTWGIAGATDIFGLWTGTKDSLHCLAGDGTMVICNSSSSINISGTPTSGQITLWVNSNTVQGVALLPISAGGNGSASPGISAGDANLSITGSWPNQVLTCPGCSGGGISGLTSTFFPKATSGSTIGNSTMSESGSPAVVHAPRFENEGYTDQYIWTAQSPATTLTGGSPATVTLSPCPVGVDATGDYRLGVGNGTVGDLGGYMIHISDASLSEDVFVTGGTCTSGAASGTVAFTPFNSHNIGYTVSSSSSGIQEAINERCGATPSPYYTNTNCHVTIPPSSTAWPVTGRIFFHSVFSKLSGYGATLACTGRGPCLQIGRQVDTSYHDNTVEGINFLAPTDFSAQPAYNGCLISSTQRTSGVVTITTATACGFRTGDPVTILWTDNTAYWGDVPYITVTGSNTFTYQRTGAADLALQTTPGVVALSYEPILDNSERTHFIDVNGQGLNANGFFNNFFDFWDDQAATVEGFDSNKPMNHNQNWTGTFIFSGGASNLPDPSHQLAAVITFENANITGNLSSCATVLNTNGFYFLNSICQATGPWQWNVQNATGNFGGATIFNAYSESTVGGNPASPAASPWPGTGIAGLIARAPGTFTVHGNNPPLGAIQTAGAGGTLYYYFLVTHDTTFGTVTAPALIYEYNSTGSDAPVIPWPRQAAGADTITYDLLRMTSAKAPSSPYFIWPYNGGCTGGSSTACGSVATALPQCSGFVCSFTDSGAASTTSYAVNAGNWTGVVSFLPQSVVTAGNTVYMDQEPAPPVLSLGNLGNPTIVADFCSKYGIGQSGGGFTVCSAGQSSNNNSNVSLPGLVLNDGNISGGSFTPLTSGRLIFSGSQNFGVSPHHTITIWDSDPAQTKATNSFRRAAETTDSWIGTDTTGSRLQAGMAFGSGTSIDQYIADTGSSGTSWLEQLNASSKTYKVPLTITQGTITASSPFISHSVTFNAGAVPFLNFQSLITCTAAAANSIASSWGVSGNSWQMKYGSANCAGPQFISPNGAVNQPAYTFIGSTLDGMFRSTTGAGGPVLSTNGVAGLAFSGAGNNAAQIPSGNGYCWANSTLVPSSGNATCLWEPGSNVVYVGTGTANNRSAIVGSGNSVFVTSNFTTAANTSLQTITGLSWTFPALAANWNFHCHLAYSQATATAAVAFGIQAATNAPTNIFATGWQQISAGPPATETNGVLPTLTTTTATNIVSGTPGATATNYVAELSGTLELPASANTVNIMVSTATSADAVTVLRGSYCSVNP